MSDIHFKIVDHGGPEYYTSVRLREDILRKPFGLTFLPLELEKEKSHIHIIGLDKNDIIASAVLVPEAGIYKMQRVVVKENVRAKGTGSQMMKFCEIIARKNGFKEIYCHARDSAVNFYIKNGYIACGDYFLEDTIPHLKMRKRLGA